MEPKLCGMVSLPSHFFFFNLLIFGCLFAPQQMGSSRTRAQTHVPCIGRWILNHCATREVPGLAS